MRNLKPLSLFPHQDAKGFSSKRIALKVDALQDWKISCLQARLSIFQPINFTGWGSEGVNGCRNIQTKIVAGSNGTSRPAECGNTEASPIPECCPSTRQHPERRMGRWETKIVPPGKKSKKSSHFVLSQGLVNCNLEYRHVLSQEEEQVNCNLFRKSSHFVLSQGLVNCNLEYRHVSSQERVNCNLFRVQACLVTTYTTLVDGQNAL